MAQQKEKLKLLLQFIDEVATKPGNEWVKEELIKKYGTGISAADFDDFDKDGRLKKIYEYCLKEIIRGQANKFYENFKYHHIKEQLVSDFIRMEHYRRQDDFENFCLALFQQIECIVNHLTSFDSVKQIVMDEKNQPALSIFDKSVRRFIRAGQQSVAALLCRQQDKKKIDDLFSKKIDGWYFNNKLRIVLFFFCFNSEIKYNTDEFERFYDLGNYIYQVRNLNHRGSQVTEYQSQIIKNILSSSQKYYLRFLGFLEEFVSSIDSSSFNSHASNESSSNKVFEDNPVLKKLKENLP